jgi:hypothetical protein
MSSSRASLQTGHSGSKVTATVDFADALFVASYKTVARRNNSGAFWDHPDDDDAANIHNMASPDDQSRRDVFCL